MRNSEFERSMSIDLVRAIAVLSVIVGHSFFYGMGKTVSICETFYYNKVFKIIYSVHMPIFMLLSGYLFYNTVCKKSVKKIIFDKLDSLLIPIFSWNVIYYFLDIIVKKRSISITDFLISFFKSSWFLWAVLYASLMHLFVYKMRIWGGVHIFLVLLGLIIPDGYNLSLYKFMYGYFVLGFYWSKFQTSDIYKIYKNQRKCMRLRIGGMSVLILLWIYMLEFYDYNCFIYTSGYKIIQNYLPWNQQFWIDFFRFAIGVIGSLAIIITCTLLSSKLRNGVFANCLLFLSKNSMCIYLVQALLFKILQLVTYNKISGINYILVFVESVAVLIGAVTFVVLTKKSRPLSRLLYGR